MDQHPGGNANPMNSQTYKLERLATQFSKEGRWDDAVSVLKEAQSLDADVGSRLMKYLQHAGRYEEALTELDKLLRTARKKTLSMRYKTSEEKQEALAWTLFTLYTDGALIAKRQKDLPRETEFSRLAKDQQEVFTRLRPINEQQRKNVRQTFEKNKNNKPFYYQLLKMFYSLNKK